MTKGITNRPTQSPNALRIPDEADSLMLETLLALDREGSVVRAGKFLGVKSSVIVKRIEALETKIQVQLLRKM